MHSIVRITLHIAWVGYFLLDDSMYKMHTCLNDIFICHIYKIFLNCSLQYSIYLLYCPFISTQKNASPLQKRCPCLSCLQLMSDSKMIKINITALHLFPMLSIHKTDTNICFIPFQMFVWLMKDKLCI